MLLGTVHSGYITKQAGERESFLDLENLHSIVKQTKINVAYCF